MSRRKRQDRGAGNNLVQLAKWRLPMHPVMLVLGFAVIAAGVIFLLHGKQTGAQSISAPAAKESVTRPEAKTKFEGLKGRWQRPDGGYVLDIKEAQAEGKLTAAYFNPRPINVSRAEASRESTAIKVFIELRDVNYPGATYNLIYDPQSDQLKGVYFQPALQQSFEVFFVRMK